MVILEYEVLTGNNPQELKRYVNDHIKQGWQPIGGICIARTNENQTYRAKSDDMFAYYQAIAKYQV